MTVVDWVSAEHGPPQWVPRDGAFSVNRYTDVAALLRHPDIRVPEIVRNITRLGERANRPFPNLVNLVGGFLAFHNPPMHTRLRQFMRQSLERLGPALAEDAIRRHVNSLLDEVATEEPVDAVAILANRLPIRVMANALGLPEAFVAGTRESNFGLSQVWHYAPSLRSLQRLDDNAGAIFAALIGWLHDDETAPAQGLRTIAALGKDEFGLGENEIAALGFFLVLAGIVTTSGMLGSTIFWALSHPAGTWWSGQSQIVRSGLDEIMRMTPPLREIVRVAGADIHLGDTVIENGTSIILKLEEAHRDPAAYADPGRFEPTRRGPPHLGFAAGGHACIGVALAYREAAILLEQLFERFDVELLDPVPHWEEHRDFRRLKRLPLSLRPSSNGKAT
jgi:cytochrome P450